MHLRKDDVKNLGSLERALFREEYIRVVFRADQKTPLNAPSDVFRKSLVVRDSMTLADLVLLLNEIHGLKVKCSIVSPRGVVPHRQLLVKNARFGNE